MPKSVTRKHAEHAGAAWVTPTLQGSAANRAGHPATAYRVTDTELALQGVIDINPDADATVLFQLPAEARPADLRVVPAVTDIGSARIQIASGGNVSIFGAVGATWISLNGVQVRRD